MFRLYTVLLFGSLMLSDEVWKYLLKIKISHSLPLYMVYYGFNVEKWFMAQLWAIKLVIYFSNLLAYIFIFKSDTKFFGFVIVIMVI